MHDALRVRISERVDGGVEKLDDFAQGPPVNTLLAAVVELVCRHRRELGIRVGPGVHYHRGDVRHERGVSASRTATPCEPS